MSIKIKNSEIINDDGDVLNVPRLGFTETNESMTTVPVSIKDKTVISAPDDGAAPMLHNMYDGDGNLVFVLKEGLRHRLVNPTAYGVGAGDAFGASVSISGN